MKSFARVREPSRLRRGSVFFVRGRRFPYLPPVLRLRLGLLGLVLLAFAPAMGAEFVRWDDSVTLHHNRRLNPPSWANVASYWREWRRGENGLYVPLTYTLWSALAWVGRVDQPDPAGIQLNPWIFHSANVGLHAAATLVVLELLTLMLRDRTPGWRRAAWIGAAVFAVHPLGVEPVAWASGTKDILGGLLSLVAVWLYLLYARAHKKGSRPLFSESGPTSQKWEKGDASLFLPGAILPEKKGESQKGDGSQKGDASLFLLGAILTATLAMLAKPAAIVVPAMCFAIDILLIGRSARRAFTSSACVLLPLIPLAVIARMVQHVNSFPPPAIWQRPFIAGDALTFYLGKLVLPLSLGLDYGRRPDVVLARTITYIIPLLPLAIALVVWRIGERLLWTAGLIFVIALLPVSGLAVFQFQQFSTVADHYMYLPMFAVALTAAWAVQRWTGRAAMIAAALVVITLAALSFRQAMYWRDDFALLPHALAVNPASAAVHNNLGVAYNARGDVQAWYASQADAAGDARAARQYRQLELDSRRRGLEQFEIARKLKSNYPQVREDLSTTTRRVGSSTGP